ncbi:uncharacterized protein P174DRAFT_127316 [Aspergillus novofumigatus IBT 16806]|uniref:Arrestin-like N-terminal domain-containing protein n=1 Tax=Aspergillus novofumigatus (strain IBT 16806) TaxID=1392255 RepID=A0A2I1CC36_ASPN1|nr:uncharacterized protein P174DRAFT_127316 [Aspergillus novofumigatus IBT 16806]PKX95193.1 hypothetical protein P174DRAFT_127316 [Aspergillus novofumigatus IBT 16806]
MLSRLGHSSLLSSRMDVQIQLDKREATYTNQDTVSGRLILHTRSSVDISAIQVTLSGSALSRLHSGRRTESHQLFHKTQRVFPPPSQGNLDMASFTLGHGTYVFPFSIPFPQVSECYRTSTEGKRSRGSCGNLPKKSRQTIHLLRRLPPSTIRGRETAGEISYTLKAVIRTGAIIRGSEIITVERPMATITLIS